MTEICELISAFLGGDMTASDFSSAFMMQFQNEQQRMPEDLYQALDYLFSACDLFEPDFDSVDYPITEADSASRRNGLSLS